MPTCTSNPAGLNGSIEDDGDYPRNTLANWWERKAAHYFKKQFRSFKSQIWIKELNFKQLSKKF